MIAVQTDYPVAMDSPDRLHPWGTVNDNSSNRYFVRRLIELHGGSVSVLDLGCAGGKFVRKLVGKGQFAVGVEGSDINRRRGRAEWNVIPEHLFTADITKPFTVQEGAVARRFDVVTAWEVLEHIREADLAQVFANVRNHLNEQGLFIGSISTNSDRPIGWELHQTIQPMPWWMHRLAQGGFRFDPLVVDFFGTDWVRGPNHGAPNSFNFACRCVDSAATG